MNSQTNMIHNVALGVIRDILAAFPSCKEDVHRDMHTLSLTYQTRGRGLYDFDLPNLESILLDGLECGRLKPSGPLSKRRWKGSMIPRFLSGLWVRVFGKDGFILEDPDPDAILLLRQLAVVGKKMTSACSSDRIRKATDEYTKIESELRLPSLKWDEDVLDPCSVGHTVHFRDVVDSHICDGKSPDLFGDLSYTEYDTELLTNLQATCDTFAADLGTFNAICQPCINRNSAQKGSRGPDWGMKHGPGAVADGSRTDDKYHYTRLSSKLRRTYPRLYLLGSGFGNEHAQLSRSELPSRLVAVPKDARKPRLIAAEPREHQWFQQLTRAFLEDYVADFLSDFITFKDQQPSRMLAQRGSSDGSISTIDLSSASDRLSCFAIERMLRMCPSLLKALHASRTRYIKNTVDDSWSYLRLRKFATQGTAVTFPVQTLFFFMCAVSVYPGRSYVEKLRNALGTVRVFGDDICIASPYADALKRLLQLCDLKVNESKSFCTGHFRESCGGDYYRGYDVTPVKPQVLDATSPSGRSSLIDIANNFFTKGLWHASEATKDLLGRVANSLPIEHVSTVRHGLVSFVGNDYSHLKMRWNGYMSDVEYRTRTISDKGKGRDREWRSRFRAFQFEMPHLREDFSSANVPGRPVVRDRYGWVRLDHSHGFRAKG